MAYYTKVLQPDETVKVVGRLHWSIYIRGAVVLAVAAALLVGSLWLPDPDWQRTAQWAAGGGRPARTAAAARRLDPSTLHRDRGDRSARHLQARRALAAYGRDEREQDRDGGCGTGPGGRIWSYGTVVIRGTGSGFEPLVGVGSPLAIRNAIVVG